jgi:hypothetical protein
MLKGCDQCGRHNDQAGYGQKAKVALTIMVILGNKLRVFCDKECMETWKSIYGISGFWNLPPSSRAGPKTPQLKSERLSHPG